MFVTFPSPIPAPARPSTPQSATSQGVCLDYLLFRCLQFGLTFESIKELGGALTFVGQLTTFKTTVSCIESVTTTSMTKT